MICLRKQNFVLKQLYEIGPWCVFWEPFCVGVVVFCIQIFIFVCMYVLQNIFLCKYVLQVTSFCQSLPIFFVILVFGSLKQTCLYLVSSLFYPFSASIVTLQICLQTWPDKYIYMFCKPWFSLLLFVTGKACFWINFSSGTSTCVW